ncbi:MAG: aldo/keto reductase [Elainellaceae cyanobacterium]
MVSRRHFLAGAASLAGSVACQREVRQNATPVVQTASTGGSVKGSANLGIDLGTDTDPSAGAFSQAMVMRSLGRTGLTLPVLGLGGSASPLSRLGAEAEAIAIIERSLELGIRYFDTAANYGPSEERLGKVLPAKRGEVVIASKTSARDRDRAWRQLEQSLMRLQTDYLDVWQFHALTHDWDIDTILNEGNGAILAAQEAQEQGLIRHVGITGHHNPGIITKALTRYPFDTALVPINAADKHTSEPFITTVLPVAQPQNTGIIAMKVPAYGRLFKDGLLDGMGEAMGYALSQPGVSNCIIAADTLAQLEENVAAAQGFVPLSEEAIAAIEARTANAWQDSSFFRGWG